MHHRLRQLILVGGVLLAQMCLSGAASAAPGGSEQDRIEALIALSQSEPASAVLQLQSLGHTFTESTPAVVRREHWVALTNVQLDMGSNDAARATVAQFLSWSRSHNDEPGRILATILEAEVHVNAGETTRAYLLLQSIEQAALGTRDASVLWAFHDQMGRCRTELGKFELAIDSFLKALPHAERLQRGASLSRLYSLEGLSNAYSSMRNWTKALELNQAALDIALALDSRKKQASLYLNRGVIFSGMGRLGDAERVNLKSMAIARQAGLTSILATALNNQSDTLLQRRDYAAAMAMAQEALAMYTQLGRESGRGSALANLGFARMGMGQVAQGSADVHDALRIFHSADTLADQEAVLGELSHMYQRLGMTAQALASVRKQQELSEQLFKTERERAVANLQEVFDTAARQKRIESLAQDNSLKDLEIQTQRIYQIVIFIGGVVAAAFGLFAFHLYRRVKKSNQLLRQLNLQLEFHSIRDPLTGLFNRRYFLELMDRRSIDDPRLRHNDNLPDGIILLDVDGFKQINDTLGHSVGDCALVEVAHRLRRVVRDTDTVVRWGGEEFLIYSPHSSAEHLRLLTQRMLDSVGSQTMALGGRHLQLTVSAGFLNLPFDDMPEQQFSWERAVRWADMAMYHAKQNGRNRAVGLVSLVTPKDNALSRLEADFSGQLAMQVLLWHDLRGPAFPQNQVSTAPAPAAPESFAAAG